MLVLRMRNAAVGKHLVSKSATSRVPLISDTDQLLKNLLLDPLYLYFDVAGSSGQINAFQKLQTVKTSEVTIPLRSRRNPSS